MKTKIVLRIPRPPANVLVSDFEPELRRQLTGAKQSTRQNSELISAIPAMVGFSQSQVPDLHGPAPDADDSGGPPRQRKSLSARSIRRKDGGDAIWWQSLLQVPPVPKFMIVVCHSSDVTHLQWRTQSYLKLVGDLFAPNDDRGIAPQKGDPIIQT